MISIKTVWKSKLGRRIAAALLVFTVALIPVVASASGETYNWQDGSHSTIVGTGGSYSGSTSFVKSGTNFIATSPAFTCTSGATATSTGTATLTPNSSLYTLSTIALAPPPNCTFASLDPSISVTDAPAGATIGTTPSGDCDAGSTTFLVCPVMSNIATAISGIASKALVPLLEISPLKQGSDSPLYLAWSGIRDFADILFIVIFLVIIFSTTIQGGFDQYTIKKMLPRLVVAVLLVQFSYFLTGALVDIGNVLGAGIDSLLTGVLNPSNGNASVSNFFENLGGLAVGLAVGAGAFAIFSTAFWVAAGPILLTLGLSLLVVLLTLAARFVILALLVIVGPLAIVAWVLPNTEKYFHDWTSALVRLVMMYPIIMAVLSVASHINALLPFSANELTGGPGQILIAILKPLIIIAAFLFIPATFKWAGKALGSFNRISQVMAGTAQSGLKNSSLYKNGQAQRDMNRTESIIKARNRGMMLRDPKQAENILNSDRNAARRMSDKFLQTKFAGKTQGIRMAARSAAMGGTAFSGLGVQRAYNSQFNDRVKELTDLENSEATRPNLELAAKAMYGSDKAEKDKFSAELGQKAPSLMRYTKTVQGRAAIVRKLSERGVGDEITRRMMDDPNSLSEYNQFMWNKAARPNPKERPLSEGFSRSYNPASPQNTLHLPMAASAIAGSSAHSLAHDFDVGNYNATIGKVIGKDESKKFDIYERDELSKTVAQTFLDNAPYPALSQTLDSTAKNFADKNRRVGTVRMIRANADLATEGNAKEVRDVVIGKLFERESIDTTTGKITETRNTDIYDNLIEAAIRSDGFKGSLASSDDDTAMDIAKTWDNEEKRSFIKRWMAVDPNVPI